MEHIRKTILELEKHLDLDQLYLSAKKSRIGDQAKELLKNMIKVSDEEIGRKISDHIERIAHRVSGREGKKHTHIHKLCERAREGGREGGREGRKEGKKEVEYTKM